MITEKRLLECIGSTEPSTFNELCKALGDDCPAEKSEWAMLFQDITDAERSGLIEVERLGGKISQLQLTDAGVEAVRKWQASAKRLRESAFGQKFMNRATGRTDDDFEVEL